MIQKRNKKKSDVVVTCALMLSLGTSVACFFGGTEENNVDNNVDNNSTANNQTTPTNNQTTVNNQTTPTNNQTTPANNQTTPANNQTTPTNNTTPGGALALLGAGADVTGGMYKVPDGNPSDGAVALYSSTVDSIEIQNSSAQAVTIKSITLSPLSDDLDPEEMQICGDAGVEKCTPYEAPASIGAGETISVAIRFYPEQSDAREATLKVEYNDGADKSIETVVQGLGRIGDDSNPAFFLEGATPTSYKLWGGFQGGADESPGSMVSDSAGNLYFIHRIYPVQNGVHTIVQLKADGSVGWVKEFSDTRSFNANDDNFFFADGLDIRDDKLYLTMYGDNGALTRSVGILMQIDASNGDADWTSYWHPDVDRLQFTDPANFVAVEADESMVYVTGLSRDYETSAQGILLSAFDRSNGAHHWSKIIEPQGNTGRNHRGYSVRSAGNGVLFVAGIDYSFGGGPFIAKLSGVDNSGENLQLEWAKTVTGEDVGTGFNSMDIDENGDVYLSMGVSGASRHTTFVKASGADGKMIGKSVNGGKTGSWNTAFVVRYLDGSVYLGGRVQISGWDTQQGDGYVGRFSASDLSEEWSGVYYTGTGANEICFHVMNGIAVSGGELKVLGQVYTGSMNFERYYGHWYNEPVGTVDYTVISDDVTSTTVIHDMTNPGNVDSNTSNWAFAGTYTTVSDFTSAGYEYQDAKDKNGETNGGAADGDIAIFSFSQP